MRGRKVILHQDQYAERKESWNGDAPEKGRQAVCAFANDLPDHRKPGVLFVGVDNAGVPTGITITDELLQTLSDIKTDGNTLPPPIVFKTEHSAVVCILHPLSMPPVLHNEQANEQAISGLSQLQIKLLEEIRRNPGVSYEELVPIVNLSRATIVRTFSKLKQSGILKRIGPDKTGKWVVVKNVKT